MSTKVIITLISISLAQVLFGQRVTRKNADLAAYISGTYNCIVSISHLDGKDDIMQKDGMVTIQKIGVSKVRASTIGARYYDVDRPLNTDVDYIQGEKGEGDRDTFIQVFLGNTQTRINGESQRSPDRTRDVTFNFFRQAGEAGRDLVRIDDDDDVAGDTKVPDIEADADKSNDNTGKLTLPKSREELSVPYKDGRTKAKV